MMLLCSDIIVVEYDIQRLELPNAPLDIECDNNSIEK